MDILRESVIHCVPSGLHDWAVNALQTATTGEEKMSALDALLKVCVAQRNFREGLKMIDWVIKDRFMSGQRSRMLFWAGEMSVGLYEFDAAIRYYWRSLACASRPEELHSTSLSNLGFCWLYKKDFKIAERCCRQAIEFNPHLWEAWKNLGVSFEHQDRPQEAFLAYFKAVFLSHCRPVPILHLIRLSQRHPGLGPDVAGLRPTVYREYKVIL